MNYIENASALTRSYEIPSELHEIATMVRKGHRPYDDVFWKNPDDNGTFENIAVKMRQRAMGGDYFYTTCDSISINMVNRFRQLGFQVLNYIRDPLTEIRWD